MIRSKTGSLHQWIRHLEDFGAEYYPLPGLPLRGDNVTIRMFRRADEDARQQWAKFQDFYLTKYNFHPQPAVENDLNFTRLRDRIRLAVENSVGEMVGYVSFKQVKKDPGAAELGICFAADQVSRGFGGDTLRIIFPWASGILNLKRIILEVDAINARAIRLYQRFGFRTIKETWYKEENPALKEHIVGGCSLPGVRCRRNQIELLSWRMEWRASESIEPCPAQFYRA